MGTPCRACSTACIAWIIGGGSSVVRATVTAVIYLALRLIDQRTAPVHAVAVAAAGLIAADPLEIAGAGLWLTFGATAALLMAARRWSWGGRAGGWTPIVAVTMASIAVELVLTPISAFVFERVGYCDAKTIENIQTRMHEFLLSPENRPDRPAQEDAR